MRRAVEPAGWAEPRAWRVRLSLGVTGDFLGRGTATTRGGGRGTCPQVTAQPLGAVCPGLLLAL